MNLLQVFFVLADLLVLLAILRFTRWNSIDLNYTEKGIIFLYFLHMVIRLVGDLFPCDFWTFATKLTKLYAEQYVICSMIHRIVSPKIFIICEIYSLIMNTFIGIIATLYVSFNVLTSKQYFDILVNLCQFVIFTTAMIAVAWFLLCQPNPAKPNQSHWHPPAAKRQKNCKMFGVYVLTILASYCLELEGFAGSDVWFAARKLFSDYLFVILVIALILREKIRRKSLAKFEPAIPLI
jgi:hypothetical protein